MLSTRMSARLSRPTVTSRPGEKEYLFDPIQTVSEEANASVGMATTFRTHHRGSSEPSSEHCLSCLPAIMRREPLSEADASPALDVGTGQPAVGQRLYRGAPGGGGGAESSRSRRITEMA
jgi:hypothetical protein